MREAWQPPFHVDCFMTLWYFPCTLISSLVETASTMASLRKHFSIQGETQITHECLVFIKTSISTAILTLHVTPPTRILLQVPNEAIQLSAGHSSRTVAFPVSTNVVVARVGWSSMSVYVPG